MSFPSYRRFGVRAITWRLWVVYCPEARVPLGQTHLLPSSSRLSVRHFANNTRNRPHRHPVTPVESVEKPFLGACLMWGRASSGFFYLSEPLGVDATFAFQMFSEEWVPLAVVSAVGLHVSRSVPKLALLYLPPLPERFDFFTLCCCWQARISHLWAVWLLAR